MNNHADICKYETMLEKTGIMETNYYTELYVCELEELVDKYMDSDTILLNEISVIPISIDVIVQLIIYKLLIQYTDAKIRRNTADMIEYIDILENRYNVFINDTTSA
jgi:hypothetical protein